MRPLSILGIVLLVLGYFHLSVNINGHQFYL